MTTPRYETLALEIDRQVATLSLNRPDKHNALNEPMWRELRAAFEWLDAEDGVRVVILCGSGNHFSSGIDLAMLAGAAQAVAHADRARSAEKLRHLILDLQDCVSSIERCRKPVLAALHGACIGGAVDIITCCDMRYASEEVILSVKEIDVGMTADLGTLQRLPRLVPDGIARELAYTGRSFGAEEALRIGLINRIFESKAALLAGVTEIAAGIAAKSPLAIRGTKEMLAYTRDHSVADGLDRIATWNAAMLLSADLQEAASAARERRSPLFLD